MAADDDPGGKVARPAPSSFDLFAQLEHHFRWLSRAIADVSPAGARHTLGPGRPSIAWLTGHLIAGADSVAEAVAALESALPADFGERHGEPHYGGADEAGWLALRGTWERVSERTSAGLATLGADALELPPAVPILPTFEDRLATRRAFLAGEVFHFAYHLGQVGSLRADLSLGWG